MELFQKLESTRLETKISESMYQIETEKVEKRLKALNRECHFTGEKYSDLDRIYRSMKRCDSLKNALESFSDMPCFEAQFTAVNADSGIVDIHRLENNVYYYRLRYLIPHMTRLDTTSDKYRYRYNKNGVYSSYAKSIFQYNKEHGFVKYDNTILVAFINLYDGKETIPDADNLDYKPFIDAAINKVLVPDDSLQWVQILSMADEEKKGFPHTEVYAGEPENVLSLLYGVHLPKRRISGIKVS